ncbi:MAG TPA: hypothetical protein VLA83_18470, partial [Candidatus Binatia bacterium]|nr:hypothetical protein [Candidatus Binatia bacterium]
MQNICYRCARPIEGQVAFCAACGAPQIRVSAAASAPSETPEFPPENSTAPLDAPVPPPPPPFMAATLQSRIAWKEFLRVAAPLAFLSGMLTVVLPPLGLFIALPASLFWSISSYRRRHPVPLRAGKGAAMGAMMALLTFVVFLVFALAAIYFKTAEYRDFVLATVHEAASRNPDPQAQQNL